MCVRACVRVWWKGVWSGWIDPIECARACEAKRKRGAEGDDWRCGCLSFVRVGHCAREHTFFTSGYSVRHGRTRSRRRAACVRNGVDEEKVRDEGARGRRGHARGHMLRQPPQPRRAAAFFLCAFLPLSFFPSQWRGMAMRKAGRLWM